MSAKDEIELEKIVDKVGLVMTLSMLARICSEKGDHIRSSYDDEETACAWEEAGEAISEVEIDEEL